MRVRTAEGRRENYKGNDDSSALPCVLGFNLWSGFAPFGAGSNILDLEEFYCGNRHRKRNQISEMGAYLLVLFSAAARVVYLCAGIFGKVYVVFLFFSIV